MVTRFRTTLGLPGRLATRLQPNHPTDDLRGIAASILDGLLLGQGDAVVGINPAGDSPQVTADLVTMLDQVRRSYEIPMQSCVLARITTTIGLIEPGAPVDLVFQSIGGSELRDGSGDRGRAHTWRTGSRRSGVDLKNTSGPAGLTA